MQTALLEVTRAKLLSLLLNHMIKSRFTAAFCLLVVTRLEDKRCDFNICLFEWVEFSHTAQAAIGWSPLQYPTTAATAAKDHELSQVQKRIHKHLEHMFRLGFICYGGKKEILLNTIGWACCHGPSHEETDHGPAFYHHPHLRLSNTWISQRVKFTWINFWLLGHDCPKYSE